jgi:hypothetical protein
MLALNILWVAFVLPAPLVLWAAIALAHGTPPLDNLNAWLYQYCVQHDGVPRETCSLVIGEHRCGNDAGCREALYRSFLRAADAPQPPPAPDTYHASCTSDFVDDRLQECEPCRDGYVFSVDEVGRMTCTRERWR